MQPPSMFEKIREPPEILWYVSEIFIAFDDLGENGWMFWLISCDSLKILIECSPIVYDKLRAYLYFVQTTSKE